MRMLKLLMIDHLHLLKSHSSIGPRQVLEIRVGWLWRNLLVKMMNFCFCNMIYENVVVIVYFDWDLK